MLMKTRQCRPVHSVRRTVSVTLRDLDVLFPYAHVLFFPEGIWNGQVLVLITSQGMGRVHKRTNRSKETTVNILFVPLSYPLSTSSSTLKMGAERSSENFITINNIICIVTCMSDYRWSLNRWLDLLTIYTLTTRDCTLQITDTN
jgi:hypothetical protein